MASGPRDVSNVISQTLLADHDPPPVRIINPNGTSSFLLIGDHAGNRIPARLGSLGLEAEALRRHIAWDIGIAGLGASLARALDAVFIHQTFSRLVVDCNRDPSASEAILEVSDNIPIPSKTALASDEREARIAAIHEPYHRAIAQELDRRDQAARPTFLVSLHSFTPHFEGYGRPWEVGVLYDGGDPAFAVAVLNTFLGKEGLVVGDNQPYRMDATDYTVPRHGYPGRRPYVELEIRQDLIDSPQGEVRWAAVIEAALMSASRRANVAVPACREPTQPKTR
jgi:predicted N-formylglutamate amidohydrolase